jgi:hypothetical protein
MALAHVVNICLFLLVQLLTLEMERGSSLCHLVQ